MQPLRRPLLAPLCEAAFAALLACSLGGCGPHRLVLPEAADRTLEDHGFDRHFWNWTRLTMGPYEVRNIRVRYDLVDSAGRPKLRTMFSNTIVSNTIRGQSITFTVDRGPGESWKAQCRETDWRLTVDSIVSWSYKKDYTYERTVSKSRVRFDCVFHPTGDSSLSVALAMDPESREPEVGTLGPVFPQADTLLKSVRRETIRLKNLHPNHASHCLLVGTEAAVRGILDESADRVYLDRNLPAGRKLLLAAVLAALHIRTTNPGITTTYGS